MGLWEFLHQWRGRRLCTGVVASIVLHGLLAAAVLLAVRLPGAKPWQTKPGDTLIVDLPKPEPAPAGARNVPPAPPSPPRARPAAPAARQEAPAPARVASAPRAPEPARPAAEPVKAPPEPVKPAAEPVKAAPEPARATPEPPKPTPPEPPRAAEPPPPVAEPKPADPPTAVAAQAPVATPPAHAGAASTPTAAAPAPAAEPADPAAPGGPAAPGHERGETQVANVPPGSAPGPPAPIDARAALRRGAGGRGGRGGIDGDPVTLDSKDPRYSDFLEQVRRRIKEHWGYPCVKNLSTRQCEYLSAQLIVEFGILKSGRLQFVEIVRSSGYEIYDSYAVTAIRLADPYPPVPAEMIARMRPGSTGTVIGAHFNYITETSLTNVR
jgi:TonB family protein